MPLKLLIEASKSRRGSHSERKLALIVSKDNVIVVDKSKALSYREIKPTYSRGKAFEVLIDIPPGAYAVQLRLVKNLYGHVKGYIEVYDNQGSRVYRASIKRLKIRPSMGDPRYHWVVERVVESLGLDRDLKRYRLPTKIYKKTKLDSNPPPS